MDASMWLDAGIGGGGIVAVVSILMEPTICAGVKNYTIWSCVWVWVWFLNGSTHTLCLVLFSRSSDAI